MENSKQVASELLRIKAVFLRPDEPFTWASGIKSPIYCDNRLILSDVKARDYIEKEFSELVKKEFKDVDVIVGTATAGIAHAAIIADILNLPMAYVRASNKAHGRQNLIEGKIKAGQKVVVIEDLISTAKSSIQVCENLIEAGAKILGIASIFTYKMQKAKDNLENHNFISHSLCDLDSLVEQAVKEQYINEEEKESILKFRDNPSDESWFKTCVISSGT